MKTTSLVLLALGLICATPALGVNSRSRSFLKNNVLAQVQSPSLVKYETNNEEIPEAVHASPVISSNPIDLPPPSS